jgi:hypothetical protein
MAGHNRLRGPVGHRRRIRITIREYPEEHHNERPILAIRVYQLGYHTLRMNDLTRIDQQFSSELARDGHASKIP